jgi:fucose 4-O-acetylase-like acetyltransferase
MRTDERVGRIDWVDTAKGIGIILVVVGHVLRGLASAQLMELTPGARFVDEFIYSFHMPLFFLLSGLFLTRSVSKGSFTAFLEDKSRTILYPYVVWSTITIAIKCCLGSLPNQPRSLFDIFDLIYAPIEQYWFLYTLFFLIVTFGFLLSVGAQPVALVAVSFLIHPAMLATHVNWYVFYEITSSAIYVALGVVAGRYFLLKINNLYIRTLYLMLLVGTGIVTVNAIYGLPQMFQIPTALCGIASSLALARQLQLFCINRFIDFLGRRSLEIFVVHSMASGAARIGLQEIGIRSIGVHIVVGTTAGLVFPIMLWLIFRASRMRFGFTFPAPVQPPQESHPVSQ